MSRRGSCVSDDNRKSQTRAASQHTRRSHSRPRSPHPCTHNKPSHKATSSQAHNPSPLKMVTTTSAASHHPNDDALRYYLPDTNAREAELQKHGWMEPIVIDDEDLMFGGKSLSAWYEEERKSLGFPAEEERRGRQRVRQHYSHTQHHHHHHHQHHHQHHHRHPPSSTTTPSTREQDKH